MRPSIYAFSAYGERRQNPLTDYTNDASFDVKKARAVREKIQNAAQQSDEPWFRYFGADLGRAMDKAFPKSQNPENLSDEEALEKGFDHLKNYLASEKKELERNGRHMYDMTYMGQHEANEKMLNRLDELKDELLPPIRVKAAIAPMPRTSEKTGGRRRKNKTPKKSRRGRGNRTVGNKSKGKRGKKHRKTKRH